MRPATDDKSPAAFSFVPLLAGTDGALPGMVGSPGPKDDLRAFRVVFDGKIYLSRAAVGAVCDALSDRSADKTAPLTDRELAVLRGVAEGQSYKEIAEALKLSVKSVETYRARLARKIGCSTRAKLIRYAVRNGMVAP
jgi:DNA-binding NarL/FixJ family response regulator